MQNQVAHGQSGTSTNLPCSVEPPSAAKVSVVRQPGDQGLPDSPSARVTLAVTGIITVLPSTVTLARPVAGPNIAGR